MDFIFFPFSMTSSVYSPPFSVRNPLINDNNVDLPHPEDSIMQRISFFLTSTHIIEPE